MTDQNKPVVIDCPHGYEGLAEVLRAAFEQAAYGKGKERHANGKPFSSQPIFDLAMLFGPGFLNGQAAKKLQEAQGMLQRGEREAAYREALGAIVYVAAFAMTAR